MIKRYYKIQSIIWRRNKKHEFADRKVRRYRNAGSDTISSIKRHFCRRDKTRYGTPTMVAN